MDICCDRLKLQSIAGSDGFWSDLSTCCTDGVLIMFLVPNKGTVRVLVQVA